MLTFIDDTQIGVYGLDETMADLYDEGWTPNDETAEEIINRLVDMHNYIPSSDRAHREYAYVLLKEYRIYINKREQLKKKG